MAFNLLKFLGFYGDDDDYENDEDYDVEQRPVKKAAKRKRSRNSQDEFMNDNTPGLVMFKGVPSDDMRTKLRDALRNGTMLLLDLSELSERELDEFGRGFITFMSGVAFASGGGRCETGREQYLVTPGEGMFEEWVEEDVRPSNGA